MKLKCPICGKPTTLESPERPFCSERCRLIDLGNWAMEKYTIPAYEPPAASAPSSPSDDDSPQQPS